MPTLTCDLLLAYTKVSQWSAPVVIAHVVVDSIISLVLAFLCPQPSHGRMLFATPWL